jgi:hypothetical protein
MNGVTKKVLGCFAALALALGITGSRADALPTSQVELVYFSNASFQTEVGYTITSCSGGRVSSGRRTRFVVSSRTPCTGTSVSEAACFVDGIARTCPASLCDSGLFDCQ